MTIHSEHPFDPPARDRDQARRFRGRVGGAVSLWTAGVGVERVGLTVSSYLVANGDPGRVLALLHPDSDLLERLDETGTAVMALLGWRDRALADVFAGLMPAPGGPFRSADWPQTEWGPRLATTDTWVGLRLDRSTRRDVGWSAFVEAEIEHIEVGDELEPLVHRRGRYQRPASD